MQRLFVHSRLPPPPACVLVQGDVGDEIERELMNLGYSVVRSVSSSVDAAVVKIDVQSRVAMDGGALPLSGVMDDVGTARVAVLLLDAPADGSLALSKHLGEIAASRHWQVRETLVAADAGWCAVSTPPDDRVIIGMTLVRDSRANVSDR
jgi:hypothetical protein